MTQLAGALTYINGEAQAPWFFGASMSQADVSIGCAIGYMRLRLDEAFVPSRYPKLAALLARCDALGEFAKTQPSPDEVMPTKGTVQRS
jgi:glutathione S-transferase